MSRKPAISRLRHRVGEAIASRRLWRSGDRVAVAVSGGLDSVCLLDLLVSIADWHGAELMVVTVDHGVREGSAGDADFVCALAKGMALPVRRFDLTGVDADERSLREGRYGAFEALDVDVVALAHHRDDQAETVLLQLLRGAGSRGLGAMRWKRDRYVRPLLDISRSELARWAEHRDLVWSEDPSNADPGFLRNRVRAEVLPLLEQIRPGAAGALARSANNLAEDDAYLQGLAGRAPPWSLTWIAVTPVSIVRRSLATELKSSALVDAALKIAAAGTGAVDVGDGQRLVVHDGALVLTAES